MALYELREIVIERESRRILELPTLDVDAHEITALLGPNGAGKSTLLETLAFLLPPAQGSLCYDGRLLDAGNRADLARRVGLVAQRPYLFDRSVRANLLLALSIRGVPSAAARRRADATLERLGLLPLAARAARALSGGEAQKVAIARTLVLAPEVLLLDEPFSFLDVAAVDDLKMLLGGFRDLGARAVVFTTHDEGLALALADSTLRVIDGHVMRANLSNLFTGKLDVARHDFTTGAVVIHVSDHVTHGTRIAIDPAHVVLSTARLDSSMRNALPGRVVALAEQAGDILVTVDVGLRLQVLITHAGAAAQTLQPGAPVWASFKSNAVRVF